MSDRSDGRRTGFLPHAGTRDDSRAPATWSRFERRSTRRRLSRVLVLVVVAATTGGCALFASPTPPPDRLPSLAPAGTIGYVACPDALTPVELATGVAEPPIPLPVAGTPAPGDFAVATSSDGHTAYVVTTSVPGGATGPADGHNVLVPVNLVSQRAERPIVLPGTGPARAVLVLPGGRTVLAASGDEVVPVDVADRQVGTPIVLGHGRVVAGMALDPAGTTVYVLVAGAVVVLDPARGAIERAVPTGLTLSSAFSPHGIVVSPNGSTVYVVGQGGTNYHGRVVSVTAATGAVGPTASFATFGITQPAALAVVDGGSALVVVDAANNAVDPLPLTSFASPPSPVAIPPQAGSAPGSGTQHPSDIVATPGGGHAWIVDGFDSVVPYDPVTRTFSHPITVCAGASSMALAPAP